MNRFLQAWKVTETYIERGAMLNRSDVNELLMHDERFQKLDEEDQEFIVEMTVGKIEQFIVNIFPGEIKD